MLAALSSWSYSPFVRNGVSVPAIVTEEIYEQELPRQHLTPQLVPLGSVHITLERSGCFGPCPIYSVQVSGDGTAVYDSVGYFATRKLALLDAAATLEFLRSPPGNRLEALECDRAGQHSIRINDQWRVCFRWTTEGPEDVEIVDYH